MRPENHLPHPGSPAESHNRGVFPVIASPRPGEAPPSVPARKTGVEAPPPPPTPKRPKKGHGLRNTILGLMAVGAVAGVTIPKFLDRGGESEDSSPQPGAESPKAESVVKTVAFDPLAETQTIRPGINAVPATPEQIQAFQSTTIPDINPFLNQEQLPKISIMLPAGTTETKKIFQEWKVGRGDGRIPTFEERAQFMMSGIELKVKQDEPTSILTQGAKETEVFLYKFADGTAWVLTRTKVDDKIVYLMFSLDLAEVELNEQIKSAPLPNPNNPKQNIIDPNDTTNKGLLMLTKDLIFVPKKDNATIVIIARIKSPEQERPVGATLVPKTSDNTGQVLLKREIA